MLIEYVLIQILNRLWSPRAELALRFMDNEISRLGREFQLLQVDISMLMDVYGALDAISFIIFNKYSSYVCNNHRTTVIAKLYCTENFPVQSNNVNGDFIFNHSSYALSDTETFALSFGLKFLYPTTAHSSCSY